MINTHYSVVVGPSTVVSQFWQAVTVIVDVVRVVMIWVFPPSVFVVVAGQTVVVVYVVRVVVCDQRASRTLARAVVAKVKIANVAFILLDERCILVREND
jgi:hypothetical protein